jgi:arylsulfatase A-like enzyme
VSLASAIRDDGDPEREFVFFRHIGHRALRQGRWKLVAVHRGAWELYDLDTDRSELRNLARQQPQRVRRMAAAWQQAYRTFLAQSGEERD